MRRTSLFRALSALLALWFALGIAEAPVLHSCPMHDGAVGIGHRAADESGTHATHAGHGAALGDADAPAGTSGHDAPHHCSCLGRCGVAAAVAAPVVHALEVPVVVAEGRPAVLRSRVATRAASSHLLPPATAPPLRAA